MPYTKWVTLRKVGQFVLDGLSMLQESQIAAKAYIKASTLDPLDPKPLSNLSAMYYEMGLYDKYVHPTPCLPFSGSHDPINEENS